MKCADIEIAVARWYDWRRNLIVPNVSWGLGVHECDLLVVTPRGYATEIEIKTSLADLKKDALKPHGHRSPKISRMYFAIPTRLMPHIEHIPAQAGIIEVDADHRLRFHRVAVDVNKYKFSVEEMYDLARLGAIRIWDLKKKVKLLKEELQNAKPR